MNKLYPSRFEPRASGKPRRRSNRQATDNRRIKDTANSAAMYAFNWYAQAIVSSAYWQVIPAVQKI